VSKNRISVLCAEHEISVAELARQLEINPATLRTYKRQERQPRLKLAQRIANVFSVSVEEVLGISEEDDLSSNSETFTIPLYGSAEAGLGSDVTNVASPVDFIDPHPAIRNNKGGYACYVVGTSMEPRFQQGEIVYASPGRPPKQEDDVIVQMKKGEEITAIIKRFISLDDAGITLHQLNPDSEITIDKTEITAIHVIIGNYVS
jgi:phage repressor protein C with HTH and peptisase S24 domain